MNKRVARGRPQGVFWCIGADVRRYIEPLRSCEAASVIKLQRSMGLSWETRLSSRCQNMRCLKGRVSTLSLFARASNFHVCCPVFCSVQHLSESFFNLLTKLRQAWVCLVSSTSSSCSVLVTVCDSHVQ